MTPTRFVRAWLRRNFWRWARKRTDRKAASVLTTVLMLACIVGLPVAWPSTAVGAEPFLPGAPGVGDPYFPLDGNGGYDVRSYDLELKYDPATDVLEGRAKIRARTTQNLSSFNFDLDGLTVHSVAVNGGPASFTRDGGELTVTPAGGLGEGRAFTVIIQYSGVPVFLDDTGFNHTDDGALVAGEPHSASTWFPVNDHPTDKASFTVAITVPEGLTAVSNGVLQRQRTADGWTTWYWKAKEPMASYLTMAAIGEFDVRAYREESIRYWDAIDPDILSEPFAPTVEAAFALQPEIIEFHESHFAKYPFRTGGGLLDDFVNLGFALENQSRPIYAREFFEGDPLDAELVFVHEIAHQWFGDSLSVARWQHIWLNEGFATYMTWLWREEKHGYTAQQSFDLYYYGIPLEDEGGWKDFWLGIPGDPGVEELFGLPVYIRGAMTLHQLRLAVGDPAFFAILERWTQERKGDNVTTDEFIALAEKLSGVELDDLFQTWLFTPGRPELAAPLAASSSAADGSSSLPLPWPTGLRP